MTTHLEEVTPVSEKKRNSASAAVSTSCVAAAAAAAAPWMALMRAASAWTAHGMLSGLLGVTHQHPWCLLLLLLLLLLQSPGWGAPRACGSACS
jgi:hypothetical protein